MVHLTCEECKKEINGNKYNLKDYIYKLNNNYFCSWGCLREFEKKMGIGKSKYMEWKNESKNIIFADGLYGTFKIIKKNNLFCGSYYGKDKRCFKLPEKNILNEAKKLCEKNYYWEGKVEKEYER